MTLTLSVSVTSGDDDVASRVDRLAGMPYADIALELSIPPRAERAELFERLPSAIARGSFLAMDPEAQAMLLDDLHETDARALLQRLPRYVVARIYEQAPARLVQWIRVSLPADRAARL